MFEPSGFVVTRHDDDRARHAGHPCPGEASTAPAGTMLRRAIPIPRVSGARSRQGRSRRSCELPERSDASSCGPAASSISAMYCRSRSTSSVTWCSLSMFSTRLTSSSLLTGLLRKSSVPASTARSMSPSSLSAVTIRIMMPRVAGSALSCFADLEAAELGHHHVEQDQVGLERRRPWPACRGRRRPRRSRSPARSDRPPAARRSVRCRRRSEFGSFDRARSWTHPSSRDR